MKKALITGIAGQDGSYLAELLLSKGYTVFGLLPVRSHPNLKNIIHIHHRLHLTEGDMCDEKIIGDIIQKYQFDEIYNLAAQSFVQTSWDQPEYVFKVNTCGLLHILNTVLRSSKQTRIYQASTSEMYGNQYPSFSPVSPYGISKLAAHNLIKVYRDSYDLKCCSGILFNHESPRRTDHFVTQKIVKAAVAIQNGKQDYLYLGNLTSQRDIGHAKDYVKAMWLMLQPINEGPIRDYEVATGETTSISHMCDFVFSELNMDYLQFVKEDPKFMRPNELHILKGDATCIENELGWKREFKSCADVLKDMINVECSTI